MILLLAAMDAEIEAIVEAVNDKKETMRIGITRYAGTLEGKNVVVAKTGVGKVMAAICVQSLIDEYRPVAMIFTGLAGSLRPHIRIGDTLIARDLVQHDIDASTLGFPLGSVPYTDFRFVPVDTGLLTLALGYKPDTGSVHVGRIGTGDQFITAEVLKSRPAIRDELLCDAVEMEGAAAALTCAVNGIPFLVARTISDMADGSAHVDFASFLHRAGINSLSLVRHLLRGLGLT